MVTAGRLSSREGRNFLSTLVHAAQTRGLRRLHRTSPLAAILYLHCTLFTSHSPLLSKQHTQPQSYLVLASAALEVALAVESDPTDPIYVRQTPRCSPGVL